MTETITYPSDAGAEVFLLTVRGTTGAPDLDSARELHNKTAGAPQSVAGARALGDLSHNVFVPMEADAKTLLFIDTWNSPSGVGQFFGNPQVQEAASHLFVERDATLWTAAPGFGTYNLLAPSGRTVVGVGLLRAPVVSLEAARSAFLAHAVGGINRARLRGQLAHQTWLPVPMPGAEPVLEVLGLDLWFDLDGMNEYYADESEFAHLGPAFAGPPDTGSWKTAGAGWTEW